MINRGTWSRVYSILHTIEKILEAIKSNEQGYTVNIISLGAGLDTLYFLLKQKYTNIKYLEFDYGEITRKKIEYVKKSKLMKEVISCGKNFEEIKINNGNLSGPDYSLINCDIAEVKNLNKDLVDSEINFNNLTIVISECFLVYLKRDKTIEILKYFTESFKNIIFLEYDLVGAHDNFGKEMVYNLLERNILLAGYEEVPDVESQIKRLEESGFQQVEVLDMLDYYNHHIDKKEIKRVEELEFLDEFEEWNLMQAHSCFGYGCNLEAKLDYLYNIIRIKHN